MTGSVSVGFKRQDGDEEDTTVAHVYQGSKITATLLIEPTKDGRYCIRREGSTGEPRYTDLHGTAVMAADMWLAGFMAGYDEGQIDEREHSAAAEHADRVRTVAASSDGRDRAHVEGAGEGNGHDSRGG